MANKKITDLTSKATAGATDQIPIVDPADNTTKRTTVAGLAPALATSFGTAAIAAAKIDFSAVAFRQINTTTTSLTGLKIVSGVGMITNGTSTAVSFGTTFSSVPIVTISGAQGNGSSATFAYPAVSASAYNDRIFSAALQTTTGFTANISGAAVGSTSSALFSWIAVGAA